jgi:uncharacterized protein YigA (DUF484 family)
VSPTSGSGFSAESLLGIAEADIADYLANNPGFFERHAELLSSVQIASPHGLRAVSLQERQMEMLRERIKGLEHKIVEMIRHSQDNVGIADRLHAWIRTILLTADAGALPRVLLETLQAQFQIPRGALRLWGVDAAHADAAWAQPVSADVRSFAGSLTLPYCGANAGFEASGWLADAASVQSLALIPLKRAGRDGSFGLLVLGSPDPTRYSADMGTEFLVRIGEIASAALTRLIPA